MNFTGNRNDLANLLGDGDGAGHAIRKVRPVAANVVVAREGESVILRLGNADPIRFTYKEAIGIGQRLLMDAAKSPFASILLVKGRVTFPAHDALKIGQWLIAKGSEAKFQSGDDKRLLVERG